jgi:hypothetical protein
MEDLTTERRPQQKMKDDLKKNNTKIEDNLKKSK